MTVPFTDLDPFQDPLDSILAEVALSVQLPPSLHKKTRSRFTSLREHIEAHPDFKDQIEWFYPQGSMAIDATISTRGTDDEYDLDVVAQLGGRFRTMAPLDILLALEEALQGYPVAAIVRQTRCVTIPYADRMHIDVTPALRDYGTPDRQSRITHAKGPRASADDRLVDMNAFGFAEWYRSRTPIEVPFAQAFHRRWLDHGGMEVRADAEVDDVPDQTDFIVKNTMTLALQLVKRYRNIRYANYAGRIPPSVMLSCFAGYAAAPRLGLAEAVIRLSNAIILEVEAASRAAQLLYVDNPAHPGRDVFTDRWPASITQQNEFAKHLRDLVHNLEKMRKRQLAPNEMMDELRRSFGDRVVTKAADNMATRLGAALATSRQGFGRDGALILPAAAPAIARPGLVAAKPNTFFGVKI